MPDQDTRQVRGGTGILRRAGATRPGNRTRPLAQLLPFDNARKAHPFRGAFWALGTPHGAPLAEEQETARRSDGGDKGNK